MNKKLIALSFLIIGLLLVVYGLFTAPVSNESEILNHYECGRITKDLRFTDKYCHDLSSAPEAKRHFGNTFVYSGVTVSILGSFYIMAIMNQKKK